MQNSFSIEEAMKFGWRKTREHSGLLFQGLLTLFAIQVAHSMVERVLEGTLLGSLATLALFIVSVFVGIGFTQIGLKIAKGQRADYSDIIPPFELVIRYVFAAVLVGLIVIAGLILFIIPGIYFALRFSMVRFSILEGADVIDSLGESSKLTKGVKWKLLGFFLVFGLLNIVGALLLLIGLIVTIPMTLIAYAHVYKHLSGAR